MGGSPPSSLGYASLMSDAFHEEAALQGRRAKAIEHIFVDARAAKDASGGECHL
jgi:hypothetical protein